MTSSNFAASLPAEELKDEELKESDAKA